MRTAAVLLLSYFATNAPAASLAERIEKLLSSSPAAHTAFWGIQAVDLHTGKTLYQLNEDRFLVPASNTKLFTTALALTKLGPDFTFETRVLADSAPDASGCIHGPLRLVGGGDPNLSARAIPYRAGPVTGNPLAAIEDLAAQVAAVGVTRVEGDILGDDTWYVWEPYGPGWSLDDPLYEYGAPVSALTINDNAFTLTVRPGAAEGDAAAVLLNPALEYYRIDNRVVTVAAGGERAIHCTRAPGSPDLQIWGTIPLRDPGRDLVLGIEDPARYAALALRQALEDRGISVGGGAAAVHFFPNQAGQTADVPGVGFPLAQHTSAPLIEDLRITDKVSQNLHAELALRAVARARRNSIGSRQAGIEELRLFLADAGIDAAGYNLNDGSGLTRLNLVTPATVVKLLRHMFRSPLRDAWISLLPVGGQDGTLTNRFGDGALAGRVHAKTGSLSHVSALSGYVQRPGGRWVAFSILVNNYTGPAEDVRGVMDRICALIME
jgi:D-alanyl-D-alanine carboxypeptidase/D-alanyl-D-alanine-endopeptidase (penicillin-binding protein 4)